MRTTVRIDDDLLKKAKLYCAESGITLTALIEDAVRARLSLSEKLNRKRKPVRLKTVGQGGTQPGIDLDDSANLLDAMERLQ